MRHPTKHPTFRPLRGLLVLLALTLLAFTTGCEKDVTALNAEAQGALISKQFDKAVTGFEAVLVKEPKNFDATMGLAESFAKKSDFTKSEDFFKKAKTLTDNKGKLRYLDLRYQEMLLAKVESSKDKTSAEYEKALRDLVAIKKNSPTANQAYMLMGDYFMSRAAVLEKDKKTLAEAVVMYQNMRTIRTNPNTRKKALKRAKELQREIFKNDFADNFAKMKANLIKEGRYDEATKRIKSSILNESKDIKPKGDEEIQARAKKITFQALKVFIRTVYDLAGVKASDKDMKNLQFKTFKQDSLTVEKGKEEVTLSADLVEIEEVTYNTLILPARKKKSAKKAAKKPADKKAEEKKPADKKVEEKKVEDKK